MQARILSRSKGKTPVMSGAAEGVGTYKYQKMYALLVLLPMFYLIALACKLGSYRTRDLAVI